MNAAINSIKLKVDVWGQALNISAQQLKILWLLCVGIICYAVFYIANIYLLQQISIADYGNFAVSLKVLAILCALLTVAKQFSLTIYMPQYEKSHRYIQKNGVVLWLSKNLILSAIILSLGIASAWGIFYLLANETFMTVFQDSPFHFVLFFLPILTFFVVLACLALSQKNISNISASILTILPSLLVISVFILGIYTLNTTTFNTIALYFSSQAVVLILYIFLSQIHYAPNFAKGYSIGEHEHWYSRSSSYWISTLSNQVGVVISLFALEFLSPESLVGEYAIILLFVVAYNAVISPLHTYLASQVGILIDLNRERLQSLLKMINRLQVVVMLIGVLSALLFGKQALSYLSDYTHHLYGALILAMLLFGISISTSLPLRIIMHSEIHHTAFTLKILRLLISCILLSILVPHYGIIGAVISDTIPMIITNLISAHICQSRLNLNGLIIK